MKVTILHCVDCNRPCEVELEERETAPTDLQCPACQDGGRFESLKAQDPIVEGRAEEESLPAKKKPRPRVNIKEVE